MSTGLNCIHLKDPRTGEWFYVLQDWDCPASCWDWREYATAYGPFTTDEAALKHRRDKHANPGGWQTHEPEELDEVEEKLVLDAKPPKPKKSAYGSIGWRYRY